MFGSEFDKLPALQRVAFDVHGFVPVEADRQSCCETADVVENRGDAGEGMDVSEWQLETVHLAVCGHIKSGETLFERPAAGFDERFLEAPYPDEGIVFFSARLVHEDGVFLCREVVSGQFVDILYCTYPFDVDAGFGVP